MSRSHLARRLAVAVIAAFVLTPATKAQEMTNVYLLDGGAFTNALMANSLVDRMEWAVGTIKEEKATRSLPLPKPAPAKPESLSFRTVAGIDTPRDMAAIYPSEKRAEAEALFRRLLAMFSDVEKQYGQPRRDLPTALALFIGTSHEAATGSEMSESHGAPLIRQLRTALAADPAMARATDADKQRLYEQLAIIGMMTGGTMIALKETPNRDIAAKLEAAGNGYMQQVLKLDPARVEFTDQGMRLTSR